MTLNDAATTPHIRTRDDLILYLQRALELEHATIPLYLTALYSLKPGTNEDARTILRSVAVEEMLHLTLVANVLNAIGGHPVLTAPGFVAPYPSMLPDGEKDFSVHLGAFTKQSLEMFLKIERPRKAPTPPKRIRKAPAAHSMAAMPADPGLSYYSIGEFYNEIERGLRYLSGVYGSSLFACEKSLQATPECYYSSGGRVVVVSNLKSALEALRLVVEQGEGLGGGIYDHDGELSHFYRLLQLKKGRYYDPDTDRYAGPKDDELPDDVEPHGEPLEVDWNAVYPVVPDARVADYPADSDLQRAAVNFNDRYRELLEMLTVAYNGEPQLLIAAGQRMCGHDDLDDRMAPVPRMFQVHYDMERIIKNRIPGTSGVSPSPTFEVTS